MIFESAAGNKPGIASSYKEPESHPSLSDICLLTGTYETKKESCGCDEDISTSLLSCACCLYKFVHRDNSYFH